MAVATINLTFDDDLIRRMDSIANYESRTRSDIVLEAVKIYIDQKEEINQIWKLGKQIGVTLDISEQDIMNEIKEYRKTARTA